MARCDLCSKGITKRSPGLECSKCDSEVIYHKMVRHICEKYGKKFPKKMEYQLYGETDSEICLTMVRELKLPISADEFRLQLSVKARTMLPSAPLQQGAERLLKHLHDYKIPLALATNSTDHAVRLHAIARPALFGMFHHKVAGEITGTRGSCLKLMGAMQYSVEQNNFYHNNHLFPALPASSYPTLSGVGLNINHIQGHVVRFLAEIFRPAIMHQHSLGILVSVTDPEVRRGKPQPDVYLIAAGRFPLKPKPKDCLVFEDSVIGVEAATKAGMQVVMVPDPKLDREKTRQATLVVSTLLDFKPELFGLPPFDEPLATDFKRRHAGLTD